MPEAKFTPGPWRWAKVGDEYVLWGEHGNRPIVIDVGSTNGKPLGKRELRCNVDGVMKKFSPDHPDMRLIAAAVQLLEALRDLYDQQNGAPLERERHKKAWEAAMEKARNLLKVHDA